MLAYLAARVGGGLDRGEIHVGHVHPWLHGTNELARQVAVARRMPGFDESLKLPVMGRVGVIMKGLAQANRRFAFVTLRPQTQINAEQSAFGCRAGKDLGDELGLANEIFTQRDWTGGFGGVIQIKKVNIRAVIELV